MTVSSATNKSGPYTGNGVTTVFAYGFRILDASHIKVVRTEAGVDTVLTTGFTVSGVGNAGGGNVTFAVAPTAAQKITLIRNAPFTQSTDLENQGAYYAETIEEALDLAAMRDQQLQEQINRSVTIPVGQDTGVLDTLIEDVIRLTDSVDEIDAVAAIEAQVVTVAGIAADVSVVADNLADVTNFADVYQGPKAVAPTLRNNGAALQAGDIYFDTVLDRMQVYTGTAWEAAASSINGTLNRVAYTATAGQTVFAVIYDVGFVDVWLNGVKLVVGDDFTATNGTSITLTVAATLGDSVDILSFGAFAMADMLQKSQNLADLPNPDLARIAIGIITALNGSARLPRGTTAQRDASPQAGFIRFNETTLSYEGYNGTAWVPVGGGGQFKGNNGTIGVAPGDIFRVNSKTLTVNTTIGATENAQAAGPLEVATGVTLTVDTGGNLVIT